MPPAESNVTRPPLRIGFIGARGVANTYSGIETYYSEVGSRLAARGHSVTVYCRSYFTPPMQQYRGMIVRRLPAVRSKHFETASHSLLATLDALTRRFDIIQYHAIGSAPLALLPRLLATKTIVSVRGLDWQRAKWGGVARRYLRIGEWASAHCPTGTAVVSETLAQYYREKYHVDACHIPNALGDLNGAGGRDVAELGLSHRGYLLYTGRLSPEKGIGELIEAFAATACSLKLVLAGGGSYTDEYVRTLREHAPSNVVFLGPVDRATVHRLYESCCAFVLPSHMEGLSLSLLEALAYGTCIITTAIPENLEVVGNAALTFPPGDVSALAACLRSISADPALADQYRRAARARAEALPDWDEVAERTEEFFYKILNGGAKRIHR